MFVCKLVRAWVDLHTSVCFATLVHVYAFCDSARAHNTDTQTRTHAHTGTQTHRHPKTRKPEHTKSVHRKVTQIHRHTDMQGHGT